MTFQQRKAMADSHEHDVIERLISIGWHAELFGQAQLSEKSRDLLKSYVDHRFQPTLLRWLPDIIAGCNRPGYKSYVCLIDAKACDEKYANYSIERDALDAVTCLTDRMGMPCFFVFNDWKVLTARDIRLRGEFGPRPHFGSGTPYLLVSRDFGRSFSSVFVPVIAGTPK